MTLQEALTKKIFLPYQEKWIRDQAGVKVWEKSRRIGASYVEAFSCVLLASLRKADGGMDCFYLSYSTGSDTARLCIGCNVVGMRILKKNSYFLR